MGIKFDKDPLGVEQTNYVSKIIIIDIVYDLDAFKFKNCLFGATDLVKISDKENYVYNGYRITFDDSAGSWSLLLMALLYIL